MADTCVYVEQGVVCGKTRDWNIHDPRNPTLGHAFVPACEPGKQWVTCDACEGAAVVGSDGSACACAIYGKRPGFMMVPVQPSDSDGRIANEDGEPCRQCQGEAWHVPGCPAVEPSKMCPECQTVPCVCE